MPFAMDTDGIDKKRQVRPVQPLGLSCGASHLPAAASALRWRRGAVETGSRTRISAAASPRARVALAPTPPPRHPVLLFYLSHRQSPVHSSPGVRAHERNPNQVHRIAHAQHLEFKSILARTNGVVLTFACSTSQEPTALRRGQGWPIRNNTNLTRIPALPAGLCILILETSTCTCTYTFEL